MAVARNMYCMARRSLSSTPHHIRVAPNSRLGPPSIPCLTACRTFIATDVSQQRRLSNCNHSRPFHTARPLRAARDDSTIDFAHLPSTETMTDDDEFLRVPIMPNNYTTTTNAPPDDHEAVMKPEISSMSADAIFLPMADMSDGHAMNIDFHAMADRVAANLKNVKDVPADEQASLIKQIWNDLVDDMIGGRKSKN